ncbi:uncharacterized protein LOC127859533 [Dreissena polymorpha]|uniref:uncharacterized protein LOC127859533 n=1 Tax=Dreissena polymorpha TaxID=45954 RepID=UPI00226544F0|nr:uncharacterized protein LOC127859533 [Dreissena polymorpha]
MGNTKSSVKKESIPKYIRERKFDYNDNVLIDIGMHMPVYTPLKEMDQPSVEEDNADVWVPRDDIYMKPDSPTGQCTIVTKETVLDGSGWDTVLYETADSEYDIIGDVSYGSLEEVMALERFHMKLTVFRKVIVATIDIYKILPHLSFVEYPSEFRQIAKRNHRAAKELLMEQLLEIKCFNHGNVFIMGLQRCGYQHLAMILDVKDEFDSRYAKKYIAIMADTIKPLIVPSNVTFYLRSTGVISEEEVQLINNAEMMQGIEKAVDTLLDKMQQRHVYWYSHFVEALRHADMSEAVELLDIPELHTECAGFHQSGGQITFNASLNYLPAAPAPPTTRYGIYRSHLEQNKTHVNDEEETNTDFVMASDTHIQGEYYDDTALPPREIISQITDETLTKIVYVPKGHTLPLGFEAQDTANYTNESADSVFVYVHGRDTPIAELDDNSSIGFVKIDGMRNNSLFVAEAQVSPGKRCNKPQLPLPAEVLIEPPSLPPKIPLKGKQPYPLPRASFRKYSPVPPNSDSYRQANHTLTEKKQGLIDDVHYEDEEIPDKGTTSDNTVENIHKVNILDFSNEAVEMATTKQIQKHHTSLDALDITSIHTMDKEMLVKRIELLKYEQTDDIGKTELLNTMAVEITNLSSCKVEKIEALKNVQRADQILKIQQAKLARIVTHNDNSAINDEYPCEGVYSARQLERDTERHEAANIMSTLLIAVILRNIQTNGIPTRSLRPLQRNSFMNRSFRRLPKTRRSSFKDSAFYSCSNIYTIYEAPGLD